MSNNPFGYDPYPKTDRFFRKQQRAQDYFEVYRQVGAENYDQVSAARRHIRDARAVPDRRQQAGGKRHPGPVPRPAQGYARDQPVEEWYNVDTEDPDILESEKQATKWAINRLLIRRRFRSVGLAFVRALGWGGNGYASLWHLNALNQNVVLKNRFDHALKDMNNEKAKMQILARSPHIMHTFDLDAALALPAGVAGSRVPGITRKLVDDDTLMWTEFMKNGDLDHLIRKAMQQRDQTDPENMFPRSVLWRIFDCLADAVVAMAYPPRFQVGGPPPGPGHAQATQPLQGPDLEEVIPTEDELRDNQDRYQNIVHFDLDAGNTFLNEMGTPEHPAFPRVQVGDFGKARTRFDFGYHGENNITSHFSAYRRFWSSREAGKSTYFTPEQFSIDWDRVDYVPYNEAPQPRSGPYGVAGNYTEQTNIFSIAITMFNCMTFCIHPSDPPQPSLKYHRDKPPRWAYDINIASPARPWRRRHGPALCDLVSECLSHFSADRPTLPALKARIAAGMAANPFTAADQAWLAACLHGVPPVPPAYPVAATVRAGEALRDDEMML